MRDESEQPYSPEYGRSWATPNPKVPMPLEALRAKDREISRLRLRVVDLTKRAAEAEEEATRWRDSFERLRAAIDSVG